MAESFHLLLSQLPSGQNNPYIKVADFGVAYSELLQLPVENLQNTQNYL